MNKSTQLTDYVFIMYYKTLLLYTKTYFLDLKNNK